MTVLINGIVTYHGKGFVILENNGLGYRILLPDENTQEFSGEQSFYTHEVIRDNEREIFGFLNMVPL